MDFLFSSLTSDTVTKMSGGKIPKMSREQAAGLLGSWIVETGKANLKGLDVVERGAAAGRGLSQYTGVRREAYDKARAAAIKNGQDPNSAQWQLKYFVEEYLGKHDPAPGESLIGWTRVFENAPAKGTPADFARYFTGSAAEGAGYFRPGVPHTESRQNAAQQVFKLYGSGQPAQVNKPPAPAAAAAKPNPIDRPFGSKAVLNGKPVLWGGKDHGWQSPASFATIKPPEASRPGVFDQLKIPSLPNPFKLF